MLFHRHQRFLTALHPQPLSLATARMLQSLAARLKALALRTPSFPQLPALTHVSLGGLSPGSSGPACPPSGTSSEPLVDEASPLSIFGRHNLQTASAMPSANFTNGMVSRQFFLLTAQLFERCRRRKSSPRHRDEVRRFVILPVEGMLGPGNSAPKSPADARMRLGAEDARENPT